MKKIISVLLILSLMLCVLCACAEEDKPADSKPADSTPGESKPVSEGETPVDFVGAWTGSDGKTVATYLFDKGGVGKIVSYAGNRSVADLLWKTDGDTLRITLPTSADSIYIDYLYSFENGNLVLSYNNVPVTYYRGGYDKAPISKYEEDEDKDSTLFGEWASYSEGYDLKITFNSDGTGSYYEASGTSVARDCQIGWSADYNSIKFSLRKYGVEVETFEYRYVIAGDVLTMIKNENYITQLKKVSGDSEADESDKESTTATEESGTTATEESGTTAEESGTATEESEAPVNTSYPNNGGDDNMAGSWQGEGFSFELEADGTGRYFENEVTYDAFWGIQDCKFYLTYVKDGAPTTAVYDYIADGGKLYLTDKDGAETVLNAA